MTTARVVLCLCRALARLWPLEVEPSDDLVRSLTYVGDDLAPETVVRAGYGAGIVCGAGALAVCSLVRSASGALAVPAALAAAAAATHVVHALPSAVARARRTRALGSTTGLLGRAVLRMRIEPSPERAAGFAARTGDGALARSLDEHVRRAEGTPATGFDGFATEWADWFPALDRATSLLVASAEAPAAERGRTLDRALSAVLEGTRDRMTAFAAAVRGPATGLYAFGVLLPLALVGVLPAARVAGVGVTLSGFVLLYDVALPAALVAAGAWLLARRPVAFPPPTVDRTHPGIPDRTWPAPAVGCCAAAVAWIAATAMIGWAGPIAGLGCGIGAALFVRYRPVKAVRDRVRAVESGLPDALYLVGRRVSEGESVEAALARASEEVSGPAGAVLGDAVRVLRTLRVDVRAAFLGPYGALSDVPSPRARGAAGLLALAATEGRPAGNVLVAMADQLDELRRAERDARRELSQVTGTLANTAAVFAPLVGGATVALASRVSGAGVGVGAGAAAGGNLDRAGMSAGAALSTADLGTAVGAYVLLLAALLTGLSVGLERGFDRALVGYRVGLALLAATATYLSAVVCAGVFV
ncbi:type II secretion system protein [Halegenticoccus soli]|uniref:type II secretion system protein n=1 Tax=Halegenticoccus soli TaxID=1985678 RepID=UPI000C6CA628|nr:type II secretion system protein [Halegenticoccus soli]